MSYPWKQSHHFALKKIVVYQVPKDYVSKEIFDSIHNFIITKSELQNRLIIVWDCSALLLSFE